MRSYPFDALKARGLHALIQIDMFVGNLRLTTYSEDVVVDGETWYAKGGVNITQIAFNSDGTPAAADIRIVPDGVFVHSSWGSRGYLEGLTITVKLFDVGNKAAGGYNMLPGTVIGSCSEDTDGNIIIGTQGRLALLKANLLEVHTITCKAVFGDDRCKIPLDVPQVTRNTHYITKTPLSNWVVTQQVFARVFQAGSFHDLVYECTTEGITHPTTQPTYPTTVGGTVTDGTAVFTARAARLVAATGQALDFYNIQLDADPSPEPTTLGKIIPQSGPLAAIKIPIRAYDSGTMIVTTFEPFAPSSFPPGTSFLVHPGCDKLWTTCSGTYGNGDNFRGVPYAPTSDDTMARA
ncbi:phage BR0599 family protein [Bradyrhizobium sp. CCBAU 51753]|uniref:baseplate hub domain-containing protein n=1 Tax=Bradyrhizobium sp. CCBAU 51753 TaxID=1325100 RepID=UPI00188D0A54|nr:phage BR0599 family protein [Bradyrhizobium sp. CCBAU 51753]QOZ25271.1 hypothetical protein XH93_18005 [Bradyrhizobium sp. CCBAU 51753]